VPYPIVLLGGASGSGKSYVARTYGRPHVELDSFYREASEDTPDSPFPRTPYGEVDWDHPGTWNAEAAVTCLETLAQTGRAETPVYSIAVSAVVGQAEVRCTGGPIAAEGLFSSEILGMLRDRGLEVEAYYIVENAAWTALARFVRDVREARKPIPFLLKRGYSLYRADASVRARYASAGFDLVPKAEVKRRLRRA
jgi:uridine kinase